MEYPIISKKSLEKFAVKPNLKDYQKTYNSFSWNKLARELDWFDGDHINIAYVAIDSHLKTDRKNKKAMIWESKKGEIEEYTFSDISRLSNKFANVLIHKLGIEKGDRVFFFLERVPEIYIGILGALKAGAVIGPLFSAFGPDAVKDRLKDSGAKLLVTSPSLKNKIVDIIPDLSALKKIVTVCREKQKSDVGDLIYEDLMADASEAFEVIHTDSYA